MKEYKRLTKRTKQLGVPYSEEKLFDIIDRLTELEDKIENGTLIDAPKYKLHQKVYLIINDKAITGTIDGYDFYMKKYLVFIDNGKRYGELGLGNEWFLEQELFPTKAKAEQN